MRLADRARIALGQVSAPLVEEAARDAWEAYCRAAYGNFTPDTPEKWADRAPTWRWVAMGALFGPPTTTTTTKG